MRVFLSALFLTAATLVPLAEAQTPDDSNEGSRLEWDAANSIWRFKWWGRQGRTYFIQHSDNLQTWLWLPLVEPGNHAVREWGFTSTGSKFFLRLVYTDQPSSDPENDDFDGDGVSNLAEVMQGTSPLRTADSDGDGLPNDWEIATGLDPQSGSGSNGATGDVDQDGLTNEEEAALGTNPQVADTDGDGLSDSQDAVPTNAIMKVKAAPEVSYAIVDLGVSSVVGYPQGVNDRGEVLLTGGSLWKAGALIPLGIPNASKRWGPLQDGSVYFSGEATSSEGELPSDVPGNPYRTWEVSVPLIKWQNGNATQVGLYSSTKSLGYPSWNVPPLDSTSSIPSATAVAVLNIQYTSAMNSYWSLFDLLKMARDDNSISGTTLESKVVRLNDSHEFATHTSKRSSILGSWSFNEWVGGSATLEANIDVWGTSSSTVYRKYVEYLTANENPGFPMVREGPNVEGLIGTSDGFLAFNYYSDQAYLAGAGKMPVVPNCRGIGDVTLKITSEGPYFIGSTNNGSSALWCYNDGKPEKIMVPRLNGPYYGFSSGLENTSIVGRKLSNNLVISVVNGIWRNGRTRSLAGLTGMTGENPVWTNLSASLISPENNLIAGTASREGASHSVLLVPVDMAVDSNRDGTIKFSGNFGSEEAQGKPYDKTEEAKPYCFWLNDDQDEGSDGAFGPEPETYAVSTQDNHDREISHPRDLEDFARLWIDVKAIRPMLEGQGSNLEIGLKWSSTGTSNPSVRLFEAAEADGGLGYIRDPEKAMAQMDGAFGVAPLDKNGFTSVEESSGNVADFIFRAADIAGKDTLHFIFEGVKEGKGRLDIVILSKSSGQVVGTGPGVWLDIKNIKKMYERANALPKRENFPGPFEVRVGSTVPTPYALAGDGSLYIPDTNVGWADGDGTENGGSNAFEPAWDESDEAIVLVHGVGIDVNQYRIWGESAFKRFWWEGYKGRFCSFRWHGETPPQDPAPNIRFIFNLPEYRAWTWGGSLRKYVNEGVKSEKAKVALVAHSLGNVVANSAIEQGLSVDAYAMLAGALSASSFDDTTPTMTRLTDAETDSFEIREQHPGGEVRVTYQKFSPPTYRGALAGNVASLGANLSNYYNANDFWLTTGRLAWWQANAEIHWVRNQEQVKPTDGHASDSFMARYMGRLAWRYLWKPGVPISQWEDGTEFSTETEGFLEVVRRAIPSGVYRTVSHPHELRAFVSRSRTLPIGATGVAAISTEHDMVTTYGFTDDQREHGAYFNRPIQYLYSRPPSIDPDDPYDEEMVPGAAFQMPLYRQLLQDIGITGAVAP